MKQITLRARFTFAQLLGSAGISRLIALKSAEAEMASILAGKSGIDALALSEGEQTLLSLPAGTLWPDSKKGTQSGANSVSFYETPVPGGKGTLMARIDITHFGHQIRRRTI